jgi:hypothetical protein
VAYATGSPKTDAKNDGGNNPGRKSQHGKKRMIETAKNGPVPARQLGIPGKKLGAAKTVGTEKITQMRPIRKQQVNEENRGQANA